MLFRSGIILFYFSKWSYQIVNELVVKGTPREGHPAKEGLRLSNLNLQASISPPREGHPAKEGLRLKNPTFDLNIACPERAIQQKSD